MRQSIVWLGLVELAWIAYWLLSPDGIAPQFVIIVAIWTASMLFWLGAVIRLGKAGFFLNKSKYLSNLVGVLAVVSFAFLLFGVLPVAREGVAVAAAKTPDIQLISIHILRLLGIGVIIKYRQGELPLHFLLLGSLPDFLFAISAVVMVVLVASGSVGPSLLITWHILGFLAFFGAGISMFFSVPSPLMFRRTEPDTSIVFKYPMLLAPNFTVPLFMIAHAFALVKLAHF